MHNDLCKDINMKPLSAYRQQICSKPQRSETRLRHSLVCDKVICTVSRNMHSSFRDVWAIDASGPSGQSLGRMQYSSLFFTMQKVKWKPSMAVFLTVSLFCDLKACRWDTQRLCNTTNLHINAIENFSDGNKNLQHPVFLLYSAKREKSCKQISNISMSIDVNERVQVEHTSQWATMKAESMLA